MQSLQFFTTYPGSSNVCRLEPSNTSQPDAAIEKLIIKGTKGKAILTLDGINKVANVHFLRELSLEGVVVQDGCLQECSNLTHLTLREVEGVQPEALAEMKELTHLEHRDSLCLDITQYIHVKRLETLLGDFPSLEPMRVVRVLKDLPNLRRVKQLPLHDPNKPKALIAFFEGLQYVHKEVRRVLFTLKDEQNRDLLFYCKQALDSHTAKEEQKEKIRGELCRLLEPGLLLPSVCSGYLIAFIGTQELTLVEKMVSLMPNLNRTDAEGKLPLVEALKARAGSYLWKDIVEKMIQTGAKADLPDKSGTFALQLAVQKGLVRHVKSFLKAGTNPNAKVTNLSCGDFPKGSLLSLTYKIYLETQQSDTKVARAALKIAKELVDHGAFIHETNLQGKTIQQLLKKKNIPFVVH